MENRLNDSEERKIILSNIEQFGCHLVAVDADNYMPGFVYSIGLYQKYGHPEIICFGLNPEVAAGIINHAHDLIKNRNPVVCNQPYSGYLEGFEVQFIEVDKAYYPNYFGYGAWFYDLSTDFPALQLVWPDKQNFFPWEEYFNPDWKFNQPLLDRNIDFKFYEEKTLAVCTTRQAFEGDPILYVYHDEDGYWQFLTHLDPATADSKIVSLEQITRLDASINEIYHLQHGWRAWRSSSYDDWQYEKYLVKAVGDPGLTVTVLDLIKDIEKIDLEDITSDWEWLIGDYKNVLMVSKFGDMFLVNPDSEIVWLDTGTGTVTKVASSTTEFEEHLKNEEKVDHWFLPGLYLELESLSLILKENEVYSFQLLPALGGKYTADNIKPTDMSVHFSINGQVFRQLKNVPEGTEIKIEVINPTKKEWWKFW
jgi:hypothetical protein